jgi:N-acetylated-alpha-linked acidic dipeptidase
VQRIPVQPISAAAAEPILGALGGAAPPPEWVGGLPLEYRTGPGPAQVHLRLRFDWSTRPIVNVIGLLLGEENPDEWVMAGGHRDAWSFGGRDPISGAASLLESARIIGRQVRRGYRPRRTIAVASWDAEEWGLIGSTEWGEEFASELPGRIVVYLNRESYQDGPFSAGGSHALQPLVNEIARRVDSPRERGSVYDTWRDRAATFEGAGSESLTAPLVDHGGWTDVRLSPLGSGSDYTVFLDHLGIPVVNFGFDRPTGAYHSRYDTHEYFKRFGDPGWDTGKRLAELVALFLTRVANANVPPFDHTATAETIDRYLDEVESLASSRRVRLRLGRVRSANQSFALNAAALNAAVDQLLAMPPEDRLAQAEVIERIGRALFETERGFLTADGLPGRPWYRHQLYAPGVSTGYGAKTLPGVREAVEAGDAQLAQEMADRLEASLLTIVEGLRQALEDARVAP